VSKTKNTKKPQQVIRKAYLTAHRRADGSLNLKFANDKYQITHEVIISPDAFVGVLTGLRWLEVQHIEEIKDG
jgi:hypothetical protein